MELLIAQRLSRILAGSTLFEGVDLRLSFALRFLPMFTCRRVRFFQVLRVFDAMAGAFYQAR